MTKKQFEYVDDIARQLMFVCSHMTFEVSKFIACQSALESSFGQSHIAKENHNIFGMKLPVKRITNAVKENRGHAYYLTVFNSIVDYVFWLQYNHFTQKDIADLSRFITKLEAAKYCPSASYIQTIVSLLNQFNNYDKTRKI